MMFLISLKKLKNTFLIIINFFNNHFFDIKKHWLPGLRSFCVVVRLLKIFEAYMWSTLVCWNKQRYLTANWFTKWNQSYWFDYALLVEKLLEHPMHAKLSNVKRCYSDVQKSMSATMYCQFLWQEKLKQANKQLH